MSLLDSNRTELIFSQALEADKAPELLHYILSAGQLLASESEAAAVGEFSQAEARRRLVEALEATVPSEKVRDTRLPDSKIGSLPFLGLSHWRAWVTQPRPNFYLQGDTSPRVLLQSVWAIPLACLGGN